ncbi:conserved hypothetical protein [Trichormus variabilis ATCC 29413]|uniref:Uncharacterized protein n=2 Tax=Anabaena variabilis TaxID=264691 RepID=Q3MCX8_TRIV2|nr:MULTISPECIES: hypothetical protein [Nostocaceae]ABA21158.1 conserved hypothetical protein [Trichormus variabilis ATCC 29413]MBC1213773.1 hypothetical protein [Trichormus variabilis ARAD]MBC1254765.1 hypothetical protein [Trichormus variabilis V5]MBC1266946.1 hypothetical protein [Trichormus variabilis FSR]MBC1301504.1 hypothetical protein [Trichormus variabilis N2B]
MPMFFLVPLLAGLATGYISQKCQDEVAYIISTFTVLSLIVSLVLAPWQIQTLLLIVVFVSTNRFLSRN